MGKNMDRILHVAVAQVRSGGSVAETTDRIRRQACVACDVGAELVLFAEGSLHGYDYDMDAKSVRELAETTDGHNTGIIRELAQELGITLLVGFFERADNLIFNSMLIASPDGACVTARKHVLTAGELRAEITAGVKERTVIEVSGVRCAIIICADSGIDGMHDDLKINGVDYRLCPTGGGGKMSEMLHEADLLTPEGRRAYEENRLKVFKPEAILGEKECPHTGFASANALGPIGRQTCHQGHCMIVDNQRVMRAQIPGTNVIEHMQDQMVHASLRFE